jgi:hypothetical protein
MGTGTPPPFRPNAFSVPTRQHLPLGSDEGFQAKAISPFSEAARQGKGGKLLLLPSQVRVGYASVKARKAWAKKKKQYHSGGVGACPHGRARSVRVVLGMLFL